MKLNAILLFLLMSMTAVADVVKGDVGLIMQPSIDDFANAYEKSDSAEFGAVATEMFSSSAENRKKISIANKAVVELQALPDFRVLRTAVVDDRQKYAMQIMDDEPDCRVFCSCDVGGQKFTASSHIEWCEYNRAFVQNLVLRSDATSLIGRCVNTNGAPVVNAVVEIRLIRTPVEQEERWMTKRQIGRTDTNGFWRVDGIDKPTFDRMFNFFCDTNIVQRYDSNVPPYGIQIAASPRYGMYAQAVGVRVPNVTESDRIGCEKLLAAFKRKTGRDWARPAPLTDFPASTNNVIYIPDMVLTPPQKK